MVREVYEELKNTYVNKDRGENRGGGVRGAEWKMNMDEVEA